MEYTIKQGSHYASGFRLPSLLLGSPASRTYLINFSQSCWYDPSEGWNVEKDWNKVVGWSLGFLPKLLPGKPWYKPSSWVPAHHWNSIRLVSRAGGTLSDPTMELALYTYHKGVRTILPLHTSYQLGEDLEVTMTIQDSGASLASACYRDGGTSRSGRLCTEKMFPRTDGTFGYLLKPFFGGNHPAVHDMVIEVTQIK